MTYDPTAPDPLDGSFSAAWLMGQTFPDAHAESFPSLDMGGDK